MSKMKLVILPVFSIFFHNSVMAKQPPGKFHEGDILVNRVGLRADKKDSQGRIELETTSFEVGDSRTVQDKCAVELPKNLKVERESELFKNQKLYSFGVHTEVPKFYIEEFLKEMTPVADQLYSSVLDVDDREGVVYKSEDLVERIRMVAAKHPFNAVPSSSQLDVEKAIEEQIRTHWSSVKKLKINDRFELKRKIDEMQGQSVEKLGQYLGGYFRTRANALKKSGRILQSDLLTKTYVSLNFESEQGVRSDQMRIECAFEGDKNKVSMDRLNAVMNPHFELIPEEQLASEDAMERANNDDVKPKKRKVAVDAQGVSPY